MTHFMCWKEEKRSIEEVIAIADKNEWDKGGRNKTEFIDYLEGKNKMPYDFTLECAYHDTKEKCVKFKKDISKVFILYPDYMANSHCFPIISVNIKNKKDKEEKTYYILRFNELFDVINKDKSRYNKSTGEVIVPIFDEAKSSNYSIFTYSDGEYNFWKLPAGIYVSDKMKKAISKAKLKGVSFS